MEEKVVENNEVVENKEVVEKKSVGKIILKVLKIIFLVITFPIWFPWRILFVRRKGRKFKEVSKSVQIFRLVRSPITKPLKFALYLIILGLEVVAIYKVRYSPVTYVFTRNSVYNYYVKGNEKELMGVTEVHAASVNDYRDEFEEAFGYIDKWNLDAKNKMYVTLDADITKIAFKYLGDDTVTYILDRFNSDEDFREDIRYSIANVNKTIARLYDDAIKYLSEDEVNEALGFLSEYGGYTLDYAALLDMGGKIANIVIEESPSIEGQTFDLEKDELDLLIDAGVRYSRGESLEDIAEDAKKNSHSTTVKTETVITTSKTEKIVTD